MKIGDILLNLEIPSNEIKVRIKNQQIKLNGVVVNDKNLDLDINENFIYNLGHFFVDYCASSELKDETDILFYVGWYRSIGYKLDELFNNPQFDPFTEFLLLRVGKNNFKHLYVLMKK